MLSRSELDTMQVVSALLGILDGVVWVKVASQRGLNLVACALVVGAGLAIRALFTGLIPSLFRRIGAWKARPWLTWLWAQGMLPLTWKTLLVLPVCLPLVMLTLLVLGLSRAFYFIPTVLGLGLILLVSPVAGLGRPTPAWDPPRPPARSMSRAIG